MDLEISIKYILEVSKKLVDEELESKKQECIKHIQKFNELEERTNRVETNFFQKMDIVAAMAETLDSLQRLVKQYEAEKRNLKKQIPCKKVGCDDCGFKHAADRVDETKVKRDCQHYINGYCRFGDKCFNTHDPAQFPHKLNPEQVSNVARVARSIVKENRAQGIAGHHASLSQASTRSNTPDDENKKRYPVTPIPQDERKGRSKS